MPDPSGPPAARQPQHPLGQRPGRCPRPPPRARQFHLRRPPRRRLARRGRVRRHRLRRRVGRSPLLGRRGGVRSAPAARQPARRHGGRRLGAHERLGELFNEVPDRLSDAATLDRPRVRGRGRARARRTWRPWGPVRPLTSAGRGQGGRGTEASSPARWPSRTAWRHGHRHGSRVCRPSGRVGEQVVSRGGPSGWSWSGPSSRSSAGWPGSPPTSGSPVREPRRPPPAVRPAGRL